MPDRSPDFDFFVGIANHVRGEFERPNAAWQDSPFEWVLKLPSATRGTLGKRLVAAWAAAKDLSTGPSPDSEADILINGHRIEIKFSTLWKTDMYAFQQIRDQNYEHMVCLGISPFAAHCWVVSKAVLYANVIGHQPQHRGAAGTDTFWFRVHPDNPPVWLAPCGGTLEQAIEILKRLKRIR